LIAHSEERERPLERLSLLFHKFFQHADFTTSDFAVTVYLATILQRLERRTTILETLSSTTNSGLSTDAATLTVSNSNLSGASQHDALLSRHIVGTHLLLCGDRSPCDLLLNAF
jgi:hypothetical protein